MVTCFSTAILVGQQGISSNQGAKSYSLGGISTVIDASDALFNNFSNIIDSSDFNVLFSSANRFGLSELTSVSLGIHKKVNKLGHFGLSISDYGLDSYSDQNISLKYARSLSSKMNISGELGINRLTIEEYGSKTNFVYKVGLLLKLNDDLDFGVLLSNPEKTSIHPTTQIISALSIGIKYNVSEKAYVFSEISKELEEGINGRIGLQYIIHPRFSLQAGYSTLDGQTGCGFSYKLLKKIFLDTSVRYHSLLGLSPAVSLKFRSQKVN